MAHVSLYRKYRPQTFDDVVGQPHVTRTLRNAVREGSLAHAYLFTGPRGTGKTTTARILAKALLCEKGPTPEPDDTCADCRDIAAGRHPDVHELDAASRTQVENVREEIIGRVAYAPQRGAWKVYIIDEVHMLSTHSFNALLKTIEEPPSHTVFVLCTTHPNKVPETIHSRCQRFDFHRIGTDDIASHLAFVAKSEGIDAEEAALPLIARHAAGGMRDALGSLEQLAAFTGNHITLADVESLLGEVDVALLFEMAGHIAGRDVAGAFRLVARLAEAGTDLAEYARELTGHFRDLYVMATVGDATVLDGTGDETERVVAQAALFGPDRLARCLDLLGQLSADLRVTPDARLSLEVTLTRMARPDGELTLAALAERIEALEAGRTVFAPVVVAPQPAPAPAPAVVEASAEQESGHSADIDAPPHAVPGDDEERVLEAPVPPPAPAPVVQAGPESAAEPVADVPPRAAGALDRAALKRAWPLVLGEFKRLKRSRATLYAQTEVDVDGDGRTLVVEFPADQEFGLRMAQEPETQKVFKEALAKVLGAAPPFRYQLGRGAVRPEQPPPAVPRATDTEPAASGWHDAPGVARTVDDASVADGSDHAEVEKQVIDELGAEVVVEHPRSGEEA